MNTRYSSLEVRDSARTFRWSGTARIEMEGLRSEADLDLLLSGFASILWDFLAHHGKPHLAANGAEGFLSRDEGIRRVGKKLRGLIESYTFTDEGNAVLQVNSLLNVDSMGKPSGDQELWECLCAFLYAWSGSRFSILYDNLVIDDDDFIDAKVLMMIGGELEACSIEDFGKSAFEGKRFNPERFAEPNPFEYSFDSYGVAIVNSKWHKPFRLDFSEVRASLLLD